MVGSASDPVEIWELPKIRGPNTDPKYPEGPSTQYLRLLVPNHTLHVIWDHPKYSRYHYSIYIYIFIEREREPTVRISAPV